jgi:hypothetical protein
MKRLLVITFSLVMIFSLVVSPGPVLADTLVVTNTSDSGTGSLRQAIIDANTVAGTDTITFNIPGAGPHTIQLLSALPVISEPVVIDGYTQPGTSPNTSGPGLGTNAVLEIELDGTNAGADVNGLHIVAGSSTVRGLVINRFEGTGIVLETNGGNILEGNFIGTDTTGTDGLSNFIGGILITRAENNTIGGTTAGAEPITTLSEGPLPERSISSRAIVIAVLQSQEATGILCRVTMSEPIIQVPSFSVTTMVLSWKTLLITSSVG